MTKKNIITISIVTLLISILYAFTLNSPRTITGCIYDDEGFALIGANVLVKGTTIGTITDLDGCFSLNVPEGKTDLVISYTGFETQEVNFGDKNELTITLSEGAQLNDEVVVSGYHKTKKPFFKKKKNKKLKADADFSYAAEAPASSVSGRLQGRVEGLAITNDSYEEESFHDQTNTELYGEIIENEFQTPLDKPLSTFGIDVDRASYSNVRRKINYGYMPEVDAVRIEEMVNYFDYDYPQPTSEHPFSVNTELALCPWNTDHYIMKVGLQGKDIDKKDLPPANLVFLIDVSGSMSSYNKLEWVKESFELLTNQLRDQDKVSLVVYAGAAGVVLPPTPGSDKNKIIEAINKLESGGSTAGGQGIKLAYKLAKENFLENGNNRVVLATDGDFNVGISSPEGLVKLIEKERKSGIFLTVLGFGTGNYQDHKMQELADKGNGNHAYIDNLEEAKKVLAKEFGGTLFTIAKDVKIQIQFNTDIVGAYRLIGYENRMLRAQDFRDDTKDAGEIGAGHTVTALYEIIPKNVQSQFTYKGKASDEKIEKQDLCTLSSSDMAMVKLRYKTPKGTKSIYFDTYMPEEASDFVYASTDLQFAATVAEFGMILRDSKFKQDAKLDQVISQANNSLGTDKNGYRKEFVELVKKVKQHHQSLAKK